MGLTAGEFISFLDLCDFARSSSDGAAQRTLSSRRFVVGVSHAVRGRGIHTGATIRLTRNSATSSCAVSPGRKNYRDQCSQSDRNEQVNGICLPVTEQIERKPSLIIGAAPRGQHRWNKPSNPVKSAGEKRQVFSKAGLACGMEYPNVTTLAMKRQLPAGKPVLA
jgi:hypothetical protein